MAHQTTRTNPAARPYAQALLDLAMEQNQAEPIGQDLSALGEAVASDPAIAEFLRNPSVAEDERLALVRRALTGAAPLLTNFLGVLSAHGRLGLLAEVAAAYDDLLDERLGKVEVDVTVARRLGPDELEHVRQNVSRALGKDAVVHQYVDESIIGGLVLRVQDRLIDASVRHQLEAMRGRLLAGRPR
jgi:F-type H+-transporting ATPase subunit delta